MLGIVGAMVGSALLGAASSAASNERNIDLSRENRDVQIDLANTAHQREVKDLRRAGLNPILSGTGGAGAAVPSSSAAQVEDVGGAAVASAEAAGRLKTQMETIKNVEEDTKLKAEMNKTQRHETVVRAYEVQKRAEEAKLVHERNRQADIQTQILQEDLSNAKAAAARARTEEEIDESTLGKGLRWLDRIMRSLHGVGSSAGAIRRGFRYDDDVEVRPLR